MKYQPTVALMLAFLIPAALLGACGDGNGDDASPTPGPASPTNSANGDELVELELTAENIQFDKDRLQAPAGSEVSLTLDNRDSIEHNFSLYESRDSVDPLSEGPLLPGPAFLTYQFDAPEAPGTYHFHCDVHPDVMEGEFVVE